METALNATPQRKQTEESKRACSFPYDSQPQKDSRSRVTCSFSTWQVNPARLAAGDVHDQYLLDTCNAQTHRILHSTCTHHRSTSIASSGTSACCTALTNRLKTRYCSPILLASSNRALHHKQHRLHSPVAPRPSITSQSS